VDRATDAVVSALGRERFAEAREQGLRVSVERAADYALFGGRGRVTPGDTKRAMRVI
jgi:hypothetical protein